MKDIPTPISDSAVSDDFYCSGMVDVDVSRDLEKKLGLAVAALKEIADMDRMDGWSMADLAAEALAQIEEEIKGYTCVEVTITEASEDQRGPEAEFTTSPSQEGVAEKSGQRSGSHQKEAGDSEDRFIRNVARAALAQIEEEK